MNHFERVARAANPNDDLERVARSVSRAALRLRRMAAGDMNTTWLSISGQLQAIAGALADESALDHAFPRPTIEIDRARAEELAEIDFIEEGEDGRAERLFRELPISVVGFDPPVLAALESMLFKSIGEILDIPEKDLARIRKLDSVQVSEMLRQIEGFRAFFLFGATRIGETSVPSKLRSCPECGRPNCDDPRCLDRLDARKAFERHQAEREEGNEG